MKRFLSSLILVIIATFTVATLSPSQAADLIISPPKFEIDADKGQVVNDTITITNRDTSNIILAPSTQDFVAAGETGKPGFVDPAESDASISVASWITVNDSEPVTIRPNEKKSVPFTITVPENAEPGGHYGVIFFAPPSDAGQVAVQQKIGVLVLVRVGGDITEKGKLDTFGIYSEDIKGEDIPKSSSSFFFSGLPIPFAMRYENQGNIHIKPDAKIEIFNTFGNKVNSVGVEIILSEKGVEISKNIVDYIPVNPGLGNVLAKSFRTFRASWQGEPYWYYNEDGTKEIRYKGYPVGIYKARLTLDNFGTEVIEEVTFIIFPWKEILGGAVGAALVIFLLIRYRRWSRRRQEEMFKKKFGVKEKKK